MALPILLVDLIRRELDWTPDRTMQYWPMVRTAAAFVVKNGPVTQQDRWEEDPGYSPFTLATEIAGLLAAADLADLAGEGKAGEYLRETADAWFNSLDRWIYASDTDLGREVGVDGYYVRDGAADSSDSDSPLDGFVAIKNRPLDESSQRVVDIVSPDALALVRFGLRKATDPRMVNTVKVIDAVLKAELPEGPGWRRYNHDGYGEHADGSPFDGTGIGRVWPLLNGERAHFELAAGNKAEAKRLLKTFENFSGEEGLLPEQTWDSADIPDRELFFGRPAGSAMPLVWAHAEHLKTLRSLRDDRIFDLPPQTVARYLDQSPPAAVTLWRFNHKCRTVPHGSTLRIETLVPTRLRFTCDDWQTFEDISSRDSGLGMHVIDLSTKKVAADGAVEFTFYWPQAEKWEGVNYRVRLMPVE
jgi:glucoamylase